MEKSRLIAYIVSIVIILIFVGTAIITRNFLITGFEIGVAGAIAFVIIWIIQKWNDRLN